MLGVCLFIHLSIYLFLTCKRVYFKRTLKRGNQGAAGLLKISQCAETDLNLAEANKKGSHPLCRAFPESSEGARVSLYGSSPELAEKTRSTKDSGARLK